VNGLIIDLTLASDPKYGLDDGELKQVIPSRPASLDGRPISGRRARGVMVGVVEPSVSSGWRATARKAGLSLGLVPTGM
jgi:hypothetical protein